MTKKKSSQLTLAAYVKRRNGVAMSAPGSLQNMLERSFTATSFDRFWQYWNPIFSFYLGRYIFAPLKRVMPSFPALILTFVFCGALHDAVSALVRWDAAFLFTPWFFFMGIAVALSKTLNWQYASAPPLVRVLINVLIIALCFYLAKLVSF